MTRCEAKQLATKLSIEYHTDYVVCCGINDHDYYVMTYQVWREVSGYHEYAFKITYENVR